jgi:hypothetical protein
LPVQETLPHHHQQQQQQWQQEHNEMQIGNFDVSSTQLFNDLKSTDQV